MRRIRSRDTQPELRVRQLLRAAGVGYRLGGCGLPGRPDVVMKGRRTVVFVHGCFWHGHEGCKHFRLPKSRHDWWVAKIAGNKARDQRSESALRELGWHVVTIWACALGTHAAREWLTARLPSLLGPPGTAPALPMVAEDATPYRTRKP